MAESVTAQIEPEPYFATIYRDDIGTGHVYGDYDPDVAYGIGRLIARDRPLRTLVALTCATGRSAEVFGRSYKKEEKYWLKIDRHVRAYEVPEKAQALWNYYCQSSQPEDIAIRELIVAYVKGILDEVNAHGATALTTMYRGLINRDPTHHDWPYGAVLRDLKDDQLTRLFERATDANNFLVQQWEPLAALLFWLGGVCGSLGKPEPSPMDEPAYDLFTDFFHFGSNSWGITDAGNAEALAHGYLQADSRGGYARAHFVRFHSRYGKLDGGGAMWEGLGPFLLNGAFTKNVAWATMHFTCDHRDVLEFPVQKNGSVFEYRDYYQSSYGLWTSIVERPSLTVYYYDFQNNTTLSTTMKVYYLDPGAGAPNTAVKLWAAYPDNDGWEQVTPSSILVDRLGSLEPELSTGAPLDMPRTLYKMLTASTAEEVADVLVDSPLGVPLNYMIGSGKLGTIDTPQLIHQTAGRIPYRKNEYVDNPPQDPEDWSRDYFGDVGLKIKLEDNKAERRWVTVGSRLFHEASHFPRANAHEQAPKIKYMASCNNPPQWIFGRGSPFPVPGLYEPDGVIEPRYEIPEGSSNPYQENPFVGSLLIGRLPYENYLKKLPPDGFPPSITLSYYGLSSVPYLGLACGSLPMRQEWVINRLQNLYEGPTPQITETEMKDLINDRIDSTAYYLQRIEYEASPTSLNWFQAAHDYLDTVSTLVLPHKTEALDLLDEFNGWASDSGENANLLLSSQSPYKQTPVKWMIFWHDFRENRTLTTLGVSGFEPCLYRVPYVPYWPDVRNRYCLPEADMIDDIRAALVNAAENAVNYCMPLTTEMLEDVVRIRTPFVDGGEYGVAVTRSSPIKTAFIRRWLVDLSPYAVGKMEVGLQSFLPITVRFSANCSLSDRKVWVMNCNVVSDNLGLPEWSTPTLLQRYKNAIKRAAEGTLTPLKLKESELQGYYQFQVYYVPPMCGPNRR